MKSHKSGFLKNILFFVFIFSYSLQLTAYSLFAQEEFQYDAKGKRNPFIPLVTSDGRLLKLDTGEEIQKSDLLLEGIIYDKNGISYAVVNGGVVGIGDLAGEYRVLKIEERKVIFIKDGQVRELELKGEEP